MAWALSRRTYPSFVSLIMISWHSLPKSASCAPGFRAQSPWWSCFHHQESLLRLLRKCLSGIRHRNLTYPPHHRLHAQRPGTNSLVVHSVPSSRPPQNPHHLLCRPLSGGCVCAQPPLHLAIYYLPPHVPCGLDRQASEFHPYSMVFPSW